MTEHALVIRLHEKDNVATALRDLAANVSLQLGPIDVLTRDPIPFGYKVALEFIPAGADVIKYGQPIGVAMRSIDAGEVVHTHNLRSLTESRDE